jgi:hypothetical protein
MYRPPFGSDTFQKLINQHILPAQCPALFPGLEPCARAAPLLDVCKPAEPSDKMTLADALAKLRKPCPGTKIGISLGNPGIHDSARKPFDSFIHTLFPHAFSLRSVSDDTTRKTCTNTRGAECFRRVSATASAGKS